MKTVHVFVKVRVDTRKYRWEIRTTVRWRGSISGLCLFLGRHLRRILKLLEGTVSPSPENRIAFLDVLETKGT